MQREEVAEKSRSQKKSKTRRGGNSGLRLRLEREVEEVGSRRDGESRTMGNFLFRIIGYPKN